VSMITLVWIAWVWAFPEPARMGDAATLLLNLLGITGLALTLPFWLNASGSAFNLSGFEVVWQILSMAVALLGIVVLVVRKPNGWGNGAAMLAFALLGHFLSLIFPLEGDFPGFVRLTQLAFFPILLTLSQRFPTPTTTVQAASSAISAAPPASKSKKQADEPIQERRRYSTDPKTFHALMNLAAETDATRIGQALTRSIAQAMLADLCFLITISDDKNLTLSYGYDLIREENLGGTTISKDSIPLLANAIQRGRPLRLPASSTSADLKGLGQILGLTTPGHLLNVPISSRERGPIGGIMILSPYSNRLWSEIGRASCRERV
jgi:hypothetical protein